MLEKICHDLLSDASSLDSKPISTPFDPYLRLHHDNSKTYEDIASYRHDNTPDITFITQQLSQYLSCPTYTHHNAALKVLKYLKNCPGRGLFFPRNSSHSWFF